MDADNRLLLDLQTIMELQIQGMVNFQMTQLAARDALRIRDWPALDHVLQSLDFQSEGLRCLEDRRHDLWSTVQIEFLGREGRFYETAVLLPDEYRDSYLRLHREMKKQTLALKSLSHGLAAYVETAGALIKAVVQELQPALKGSLYSKSGSIRGGSPAPLVLNAHF